MNPNLLIIGAARSATTAIAFALDEHPDVALCQPKEVHFLAFGAEGPNFRGPGDEEKFNRILVRDADRYHELWQPSPARWRVDASVSTLYRPEASLAAIAEHVDPDAKAICLLREPAARARSAYRYLAGAGYEEAPSFAAGLALEDERIAAGYHHLWHYRAMSRYAEQLPAFVEAFGDRLFVGVTEELTSDPEGFSARLGEFLELDSSTPLDLSVGFNRGGEPRSGVVAGATRFIAERPAAKEAVLRVIGRRGVERINNVNRRRADVDPAELALRAEFAADVDYVEQLLGRSIPTWHARSEALAA